MWRILKISPPKLSVPDKTGENICLWQGYWSIKCFFSSPFFALLVLFQAPLFWCFQRNEGFWEGPSWNTTLSAMPPILFPLRRPFAQFWQFGEELHPFLALQTPPSMYKALCKNKGSVCTLLQGSFGFPLPCTDVNGSGSGKNVSLPVKVNPPSQESS